MKSYTNKLNVIYIIFNWCWAGVFLFSYNKLYYTKNIEFEKENIIQYIKRHIAIKLLIYT